MSRWHADIWSHHGHYLVRSLHLTLVTKWSRSLSWMTYSPHFVQYRSALPFWDTAIHGQGHVWSMVKVTFDLENAKVRVKPIGHISGLEFNRYVCFSFRGNRTTFGWDIANSIFALEKSRSWPRSNPMVTFEAWSSIDMFAFLNTNNKCFQDNKKLCTRGQETNALLCIHIFPYTVRNRNVRHCIQETNKKGTNKTEQSNKSAPQQKLLYADHTTP